MTEPQTPLPVPLPVPHTMQTHVNSATTQSTTANGGTALKVIYAQQAPSARYTPYTLPDRDDRERVREPVQQKPKYAPKGIVSDHEMFSRKVTKRMGNVSMSKFQEMWEDWKLASLFQRRTKGGPLTNKEKYEHMDECITNTIHTPPTIPPPTIPTITLDDNTTTNDHTYTTPTPVLTTLDIPST